MTKTAAPAGDAPFIAPVPPARDMSRGGRIARLNATLARIRAIEVDRPLTRGELDTYWATRGGLRRLGAL